MPCKWQTPRESDGIRDWGYGCRSPYIDVHYRLQSACKPSHRLNDCYQEAEPEAKEVPMPCKWQERETNLPLRLAIFSWMYYRCRRGLRAAPFRPGCSPDKECYEEAKAKEVNDAV